jgi:hypothetical protein
MTEGTQVVLVHVFAHENGQAPRDPVAFKGEFLYGKAKKVLKFIGSPVITSIDAANKLGLTLNDFAVHDTSKDVLFLADAGVHKDAIAAEVGTLTPTSTPSSSNRNSKRNSSKNTTSKTIAKKPASSTPASSPIVVTTAKTDSSASNTKPSLSRSGSDPIPSQSTSEGIY